MVIANGLRIVVLYVVGIADVVEAGGIAVAVACYFQMGQRLLRIVQGAVDRAQIEVDDAGVVVALADAVRVVDAMAPFYAFAIAGQGRRRVGELDSVGGVVQLQDRLGIGTGIPVGAQQAVGGRLGGRRRE